MPVMFLFIHFGREMLHSFVEFVAPEPRAQPMLAYSRNCLYGLQSLGCIRPTSVNHQGYAESSNTTL